jgi:anaerobic ribonucleoside-triphosphate reductase activating protein
MASSARASTLRVGGLVPLSTADYPDHLSAVVFCQGCPWRCAYCHNPHLMPRRSDAEIGWPKVLAFLERRRELLDAVVFSGGEPTLQPALPDAVQAVKEMGYRIALHTAGIDPRRLAQVLPFVDWVGMDIKTDFRRYTGVTGVPRSGEKAQRSVEIILASGVAHEFRTTVHPKLVPEETLQRLADELTALGVQRYVVQEFRPDGCRSSALLADRKPGYLDEELYGSLAPQFEHFSIRRAGHSPVF